MGTAAEEMLGRPVDEALAGPCLDPSTVTWEDVEGRTYGEALQGGVSIIVRNGIVTTVQLHGGGHEGYAPFPGELPCQVRFDDAQPAVRARLGAPTSSGEPKDLPSLGTCPAWDRYDFEDVVLHFEYTHDGRAVRLVSLMMPAFAP